MNPKLGLHLRRGTAGMWTYYVNPHLYLFRLYHNALTSHPHFCSITISPVSHEDPFVEAEALLGQAKRKAKAELEQHYFLHTPPAGFSH
jgi:hypothetical protein